MAACLFAVLAMCTSAVAACACSHHQPEVKAEEKPSCHSSSHTGPSAAAEDVLDSSSLHSGCNCYVNDRTPAITAKSESKKFSAVKVVAAGGTAGPAASAIPYSYAAPATFDSFEFSYSGGFLSSGPSRAPPRL